MEYESFIASGRFIGALYELIDDYDIDIEKDDMVKILKDLASKLDATKAIKKGEEDYD